MGAHHSDGEGGLLLKLDVLTFKICFVHSVVFATSSGISTRQSVASHRSSANNVGFKAELAKWFRAFESIDLLPAARACEKLF
jgi:hypothetical protein